LFAVKKKVMNKTKVHEGELLNKVRTHFDLNHKDFAKVLDITYNWEYSLLLKDQLPEKIKVKASKIFRIPGDFWIGQGELPPPFKVDVKQVEEPESFYYSRTLQDLKQKVSDLEEKIAERDKRLQLQEELLRLMKEKAK